MWNNKNRVFLLLCVCVLYTWPVICQDFQADLKKGLAYQHKMPKYHSRITTKTYSAETNGELNSTVSEIKKDGVKLNYDTEGFLMILNVGYTVIVDKEEKTIVCNKNNISAEVNPIESIESSLKEVDTGVKFEGLVGEYKLYSYVPKSNDLTKVEIFLHQSNLVIGKLVYHYKDNSQSLQDKEDRVGRSVIIFDVINSDPNWPQNTFSGADYVSINKDVVKLKPKYSKYDLILGDGFSN